MLNKKQLLAISLIVQGDLNQKEIATLISVNPVTLCNWKKNKDFQVELDRQMRDEINSIAPKAKKKMEQLLYAKSQMVQFMAAKDILDRSGFKPKERAEIEHTGKDGSEIKVNIKVIEGENIQE